MCPFWQFWNCKKLSVHMSHLHMCHTVKNWFYTSPTLHVSYFTNLLYSCPIFTRFIHPNICLYTFPLWHVSEITKYKYCWDICAYVHELHSDKFFGPRFHFETCLSVEIIQNTSRLAQWTVWKLLLCTGANFSFCPGAMYRNVFSTCFWVQRTVFTVYVLYTALRWMFWNTY